MYTELLEKYLDRDAPHGELLTETQLRHLRSFAEWLEEWEAAQHSVEPTIILCDEGCGKVTEFHRCFDHIT